jgi:cellulose synthase (UDP-forming)
VALVVLYLIAGVAYLLWRPSTFNTSAPVFSVVLYAAELFGFLTALMHISMVWRLSVREPPEPPPGLRVDVFVTTYNEPVEMLRRTLLAAKLMHYPHTTWLLDDGNRPEMKALAVELEVLYLSRERNENAKAGNLNNALRFARGEFVCIFDADHAPSREFLLRTLGYFTDPDVAFVSTPQDFYNLDSFQHRARRGGRLVWNEQSLFFRVIQRGKDMRNATFFCGTCGVLRRAALDEIGGFSVATLTEDLDTSLRIHQKGWKSVYHAQSLAFGLAPTDIVPFIKQRMRWGQGAMQVLRRHGFVLFARGLSPEQKLNYFASIVMYFDGWQKLVFYLAPVIVLTTGVMPISELSWEFLARFVPYFVLSFWVFEEVGRGYGRTLDTQRYDMARYAAFIWATTALVRDRLRFRVTDKIRAADAATAARRFMLPQTLVLTVNALAVPVGVLLYGLQVSPLPLGAVIANVFWACVNASLAQLVIGFTRRIATFHRREYRFPIPLPAMLDAEGRHPQAGVLDDVSGDGFKYYGQFPDSLRVGDLVYGEIVLPASRVRFRAQVRAMFGSSRDGDARALGCEFLWERPESRDELLAFLYGSDLQWKLNRFAERSLTPLDRLRRWMRPTPRDGEEERPRWASALIRSRGGVGETRVGVIAVRAGPDEPRTLIAFRRIGVKEDLTVYVTTRTGTQPMRGTAVLFDAMLASGTPLYFYRFEPSGESPAELR